MKVLLINQEKTPHYRVAVYSYLSHYLSRRGYKLTVVSEGTQDGSCHAADFEHQVRHLNFFSVAALIFKVNPDVLIYWVRLRHLYLFPVLILLKLLGKKAVYWGHGSDLLKTTAIAFRRFANRIEYQISDALVLYSTHQLGKVSERFHYKTFIANNTLSFQHHSGRFAPKGETLTRYEITTPRNIICVGRMQKRKRIDHLVQAHRLLKTKDVGVIFVGPDTENVLEQVNGPGIYKLGEVYGDRLLDLLYAADVFCIPGAVGLSIVDAFYCGLPLVTEEGDASPEMMYLKQNVNGFVVPRGNIPELAAKLDLLLSDGSLRDRFSAAAKEEIGTNGHIDRMSEGFLAALDYVSGRKAVMLQSSAA
ncbi:MAG TPA: glycosyltransferase family 4 protein [Verrucomicrobiae bacterium]|nr:glycosyltransferase family 4 protein [Verrucomicrobiae bacterium]